MPFWDAVTARQMHDQFDAQRNQLFQESLREAKLTPAINDKSSKGAIYQLAKRIADQAFFKLKEQVEIYDEENRDRIMQSFKFNQRNNYKPLVQDIEKILFSRQEHSSNTLLNNSKFLSNNKD